MTNEAFNKGFSALSVTFPGMNFDVKLFWEMLSDLDGQYFLMAVMDIIKTTKEFYPGTNIIATIRIRADELKIEYFQNNSLKIEAETEKERIDRWQKEATPMPEECRIALEKLGIKTPPAN